MQMRDLEIKHMRQLESRERYEAREWRWKREFAQVQELLCEVEETNERQVRAGEGLTSTLPVQISALAHITKRANTLKAVSVLNKTPVGTVKTIITAPPPKIREIQPRRRLIYRNTIVCVRVGKSINNH
jgi:hypothetical protein